MGTGKWHQQLRQLLETRSTVHAPSDHGRWRRGLQTLPGPPGPLTPRTQNPKLRLKRQSSS